MPPIKLGWESEFLRTLERTGNVKQACKHVGIGRSMAYQRRREVADFAEAWDDAIDNYVDDLEAEADRRSDSWDDDAAMAPNRKRRARPSDLRTPRHNNV